MKALTLYQPHACLMAIGAKKWETRPRRTHLRGELAIHSAKKSPQDYLDLCKRKPFSKYIQTPVFDDGAILAVVVVYDCITSEQAMQRLCLTDGDIPDEWFFGNYELGRFVYLTRCIRKLETPIPCRGAQGFWNVPAEVEAQVRAQIAPNFNYDH